MTTNFLNENLDLPEELVPLMMESHVCEYASITNQGSPITSPLIPNPGQDGMSIDINTGLAYPWKAERARKNPKVCLLYSDPGGLRDKNSPIILIYGHAVVRDSDLQGNTDRYVGVVRSNSSLFGKMPLFVLDWMAGYIARIWISIYPLKVLWWPGRNLDQKPEDWQAPHGIILPQSDPPPKALDVSHPPLTEPPADMHNLLTHAAENLGQPVLTVVDTEGYPVPFRTAKCQVNSKGVQLGLHPAMPVKSNGQACLTFHDLQIKKGEMISNENYSFCGEYYGNGQSGNFKVQRQLPSASFKRGLGEMIALGKMMMRMKSRLQVEAERRGQPVPTVRLVD